MGCCGRPLKKATVERSSSGASSNFSTKSKNGMPLRVKKHARMQTSATRPANSVDKRP